MKIVIPFEQYIEIKCEEINKIKNCLIEITEIQDIVKGSKLKNTQKFLLGELKRKLIEYTKMR